MKSTLNIERSPIQIPKPNRFKHRSSLTSSGSSANSSFDATYDSGLSLSKDYSSSTSDSSLSDQYKIWPKQTPPGNHTSISPKSCLETPLTSNFKRDVVDQ